MQCLNSLILNFYRMLLLYTVLNQVVQKKYRLMLDLIKIIQKHMVVVIS
nr:MAG TPA: hypothetical protein [Bacteriophage sp.]